MATYDWNQGEIRYARLHEELLRAGGSSIAVSIATDAILMLTPAAPGIVVIAVTRGVVIAADMAYDWGLERENEHLVAREDMIRYGFVPNPEDADRRQPWSTAPNPLRESLDHESEPDASKQRAEDRLAKSWVAPALSTSPW